MFFLNNKGSSIVQTMVLAGVGAVIISTMMDATVGAHKQVRALKDRHNVESISINFRNYLSSESVCTRSMLLSDNTKIYSNTDQFNIGFDIKGFGYFKNGKSTANSSVAGTTIEDLVTEEMYVSDPVLTNTGSLGFRTYTGMLYIRLKGKKSIDLRARQVGSINFLVDGSGRPAKCSMLPLQIVGINNPGPGGSGGTPGRPGTPGSPNGPNVPNTPGGGSQCSSFQQCIVYDYFQRNFGSNPNYKQQADKWMGSNTNWTSIAKSYSDSMTTLDRLKLLGQIRQTGRGPNANTVDQWVAEAVENDPQGRSMLATSQGLKVIQDAFGTQSSAQVLRKVLTQNADITMNSSLGVGTWANALGYKNTAQFIGAHPELAAGSAMSPGGKLDPSGAQQVAKYLQANPRVGVEIANGTGIWSKNLSGGVNGVVNHIANNISDSMTVAQGTNTWAQVKGRRAVGSAIKRNANDSAAIARGTGIANRVFGRANVNKHIKENANEAAQIARDLASFKKKHGWSEKQMKDYVAKNPNTWKKDLKNTMRSNP